jgi:hypothetical protein
MSTKIKPIIGFWGLFCYSGIKYRFVTTLINIIVSQKHALNTIKFPYFFPNSVKAIAAGI